MPKTINAAIVKAFSSASVRGMNGNSTAHPPFQTPKSGEKHKQGLNNALQKVFDRCEWSKYQKKLVSEKSILELPRVENCISGLCPPIAPPNTQIT